MERYPKQILGHLINWSRKSKRKRNTQPKSITLTACNSPGLQTRMATYSR